MENKVYITSIEGTPKNKGDKITFHFSNGKDLTGKVLLAAGTYFISTFGEPFRILGIYENRKNWVKDIVGYDVYGDFPEVRTLSDLEKVLKAMTKVNRPNKCLVNKHKSIKLNFKL